MRADQERVKNLLSDTVTLLCRNGLEFRSELRVEGLIGITLDNNDIFLVHINEKFSGDGSSKDTDGTGLSQEESVISKDNNTLLRDSQDLDKAVHSPGKSWDRNTPRKQRHPQSPSAHQSPRNAQTPTTPTQRHRHRSQSDTSDGGNSERQQDIIPAEKIKKEEDVIIVETGENSSIVGTTRTPIHSMRGHRKRHSQAHSTQDDTEAMQLGYSDMGFSVDQGESSFGQYEHMTDSQGEPPTKRHAAGADISELSTGSGDSTDVGAFITGLVRNVHDQGSSQDWMGADMTGFSGMASNDSSGQAAVLPGCSTWPSQVQRSTAGMGSPQDMISLRGSGSFPCKRSLPSTHLQNLLRASLITPLREKGVQALAFRCVWRGTDEQVEEAWSQILQKRLQCDAVVHSQPEIKLFMSSVSGIYICRPRTRIYPAVSYFAVLTDPEISTVALLNDISHQLSGIDVKAIRHCITSEDDMCSSLYIVCKDHNNTYVHRRANESMGQVSNKKPALTAIVIKDNSLQSALQSYVELLMQNHFIVFSFT